jgi:L-lactate permease
MSIKDFMDNYFIYSIFPFLFSIWYLIKKNFSAALGSLIASILIIPVLSFLFNKELTKLTYLVILICILGLSIIEYLIVIKKSSR